MGSRGVQASIAVDDGVHVKPALECAGGIGNPLVQVAHEVVKAFRRDAAGIGLGAIQGIRQLVQAGVIQFGVYPGVGRAVVLHGGVNVAGIVAHAWLTGVAVRVDPLGCASAGGFPLGARAQALSRGCTGGRCLSTGNVALGNGPRGADRPHSVRDQD